MIPGILAASGVLRTPRTPEEIVAALFSGGAPGVWLQPNRVGNVYSDRAGLSPVQAPPPEDYAARIRDISGNGNDAVADVGTPVASITARYNRIANSNSFSFDSNAWVYTGGTTTGPAGIPSASGGAASYIQFSNSSQYIVQENSGALLLGRGAVLSYDIMSTAPSFQFANQTRAGTDVFALESLGGGWYRHRITRTFSANTPTMAVAAWGAGPGGLGPHYIANFSVVPLEYAGLAYQETTTEYSYISAEFPTRLAFRYSGSSYRCPLVGGGDGGMFFSACISPTNIGPLQKTIISIGDYPGRHGYLVQLTQSGQLRLSAGNFVGGEYGYVTVTTTDTVGVGETAVITCWDDGDTLNVQLRGEVVSVPRGNVAIPATIGITLGGAGPLDQVSQIYQGYVSDLLYVEGVPPNSTTRGVVVEYLLNNATNMLS